MRLGSTYNRSGGPTISNIDGVRSAERKVQDILDKLRNAGALDPQNLHDELKKATDEYARVVRELVVAPQDR